MKLKELQLTKDLKNKNEPQDILIKYGWKYMGSGANGAVARHPSKDYILKLFRNDMGYISFVDFVLSHNNIHLPNLSKAKQLPGTDYFYVRMEELTPVTPSQLTSIYLPEIIYFVVTAEQYGMRITDILTVDLKDKLDELDIDYSIIGNIDLDNIFHKLGETPDQAWMQLTHDLIEYGEQIGELYFDLHDENFMRRGNTLIINDPW